MLISMCVIHAGHGISSHTERHVFSFFLSFSCRVFSCLPFDLMRFSDISRSFRYSHFFSSKKDSITRLRSHTHTQRERVAESSTEMADHLKEERETEESG